MKKLFCFLLLLIAAVLNFISCKKELSCDSCEENNKPPSAVAGPDQFIRLPVDSVVLDGSASSDPDGTIRAWQWRKVDGPASFGFGNAASAKTAVKSLDTGVYRFELMVTDNGGSTAKDTMLVTVGKDTPTNRPPVAHAGNDTTIVLPANTAPLDGSRSSDPDNNISSYLWTKLSGPSTFTIINANTVKTLVINLVEGVYLFELKVTDAGGLFSKDTVEVIVFVSSPPSSASCPPANRPIVTAQLVAFGNLSLARAGIAAVSAGNKLFFAGGYNASGASSRVDIYDMATQSWSIAELSLLRSNIAAVAVGDKIFFAGGRLHNDRYTTRVDIYDLSTRAWSTAELSEARDEMVTAVVGSKVFFAGGYKSVFISVDPSSRIDIYDLNTRAWSTAELSEARSGLTAVTAGNKIYFAGGYDGNGSGTPTDKIDIYDDHTGAWSTSVLNEPRAYFAGIHKNGKIYWAGGATYINVGSGEIYSCKVEIRDINTQVSAFANLSWTKQYIKAFGKDDKIVYLQGTGSWGSPSQYFDIHDITSNSWSIGVLNQSEHFNTGAIVLTNNIIYVAGGILNNGNGSIIYSSQVWKLEF